MSAPGPTMAASWLAVQPRSPLVFRSGLPFGSAKDGGGDDGYRLPRPVTLAGGTRAAWADASGHFLAARWQEPGMDRFAPHAALLDGLHVGGPLVARVSPGGATTVLAPAPADAYLYRDPFDDRLMVDRLHPSRSPDGAGCALPDGLLPLTAAVEQTLAPDDALEDAPPLWDWNLLCNWLARPSHDAFALDARQAAGGFALDVRGHQQRAPGGGTLDGSLHQSAGIDGAPADWWRYDVDGGAPRLELLARVSGAAGFDPACLGGAVRRLGADGRSARYLPVADVPGRAPARHWAGASPDECPAHLRAALGKIRAGDVIRLVLVTPGVFDAGWHPGFLAPQAATGRLEGRLPSGGPGVRLVAAAVPRWTAHSGIASVGRDGGRGPRRERAVRWAVPAGAVYWLQLLEPPDAAHPLADALWLRSLACAGQDRRDGWALAVPGLAKKPQTDAADGAKT